MARTLADRLSAALVRQEALALRSEDEARRYRELAQAAVAIGLPEEATYCRRMAEKLMADAEEIRRW